MNVFLGKESSGRRLEVYHVLKKRGGTCVSRAFDFSRGKDEHDLLFKKSTRERFGRKGERKSHD